MTTLPDLIARAHLAPNDPAALDALALGLVRAGRITLDMGWLSRWLSHATKIIFALGQAGSKPDTGLGRVNIHAHRIRSTRDGAGALVIADAEIPVTAIRTTVAVLIDAELYVEKDGKFTLIIEVSSRDTEPFQLWQWEREGHKEGHNNRMFAKFATPATLREIHFDITPDTLQSLIIEAVAGYMMRCREALREATIKQNLSEVAS